MHSVNDIRILAIISLLCWLPETTSASQTDSSIFSKPLKIEATVKTERTPRSEQKGDTLIFNAAAYQVIENADSERLISKMPGISVSDGGIEANGKEVARILLDGQEFFGNDVLTALRNVPADMVKQIEIINRMSDEGQLTGVDDGNGHLAINIVTKRKKGTGLTKGRIYGSYGISDDIEHKHNYIAGGNISHFTDNSTISVIGMSNNISKFNFTSSDILSGVTGLDAKNGSTFKVKSLSGLTDVHGLGANYTSKTANFTYFFNDLTNRNNPLSDKVTRTQTEGLELLTHNENNYKADNTTHKLDGKISISPRKRHSLIIRPSITLENSLNGRDLHGKYSYSDGRFLRVQRNISDNERWSIKGSVNASYRYRFTKKRRSLSINARYGFNKMSALDNSWEYRWKDSDAQIDSLNLSYYSNIQYRDKNTFNQSASSSLTFTEPISKRSHISAIYTFVLSDQSGENLAYPFNKTTQEYDAEPKTRSSARNRSSFYHNRAALRYNYSFKKMSISATATYQNTIYIENVELPEEGYTYKTYHHPLYNTILNIPINTSNTLRIEAKGHTQNPGSHMIRDIVDRTSSSNVRAGNPNLEPAYMNNAEIRYINTNRNAGTTFSFSAKYTGSHNYFCDSLVINNPDFIIMKDDDGNSIKLGEGNQYVKPINLDGYHKLSAKVSFATPVDFLRCNFNLGIQTSIIRLPGVINDEKAPINRDWFQLSGRLDSNISKSIDFTISYNIRYTTNTNHGKFGKVENNFMTHRAYAQLKWILAKDFSFTGAFLYKKYKSTLGLYNDDFYLCDIFIGKRFMRDKRLEISAGVNDLFNNNVRTYWHSVSASSRTDGSHLGLGRYFSIQAIWHFNYGTKPKSITK